MDGASGVASGLEFVEDDDGLCDEEEAQSTAAAPVDSAIKVEADGLDSIKGTSLVPPAPANDVENMTWEWVLATVVVPPSADPQERQAMELPHATRM